MTDLLEDPEDVNRAQHRIASTNQRATNMDNMSHNVVGAVWRWGMREKWSKIKPKSRTREASVEVLAVLDQPHSLGLLPEATVLDVPLGLYPCEVERKRDVFNSETRWLLSGQYVKGVGDIYVSLSTAGDFLGCLVFGLSGERRRAERAKRNMREHVRSVGTAVFLER